MKNILSKVSACLLAFALIIYSSYGTIVNFVFAAKANYSVSLTEPISYTGTTVNLYGVASGTPYVGGLTQQHLRIWWTTPISSTPDLEIVVPPSAFSGSDFTYNFGPISHNYMVAGTYTITAKVCHQGCTGSEGTDYSTDTSIIVINPNTPPVANAQSQTLSEDTSKLITLTATDTDIPAQTLSYSIVTPPAHGTLSALVGPDTTYTPFLNYNGMDSFTFQVSDGHGGVDTALVTLSITPVNDAPVANDDTYNTNEDTTLNVASPGVLSNDTDVDSGALTATKVSDPTHGTVTLNSDGSFQYVPNAGYNGTDSFTYVANDTALNSNTGTVTIVVNSVADAPVAMSDTYSTNEDTALNIIAPGILTNDTDEDLDMITAKLVTDVTNGTLILNSDGSFLYTPFANYNGTDTFTYQAFDGIYSSSVTTVTITINPVNDAPVVALLGAEEITIVEGSTFTDPEATCTDVEESELTPTISGTVDANTPGTYILTYTCTDSNGATDSTTRTVHVGAKIYMCSDGIDNDEDGKTDYPADPGCTSLNDDSEIDPEVDLCVNFEGIQTEIPQGMIRDGEVCYTPSTGGGGAVVFPPVVPQVVAPVVVTAPVGQVLGAITKCGIYVDKYLRKGYKNDASAVLKLQQFLNKFEGTQITEDGFYGLTTENGVKNFQAKYAEDVLKPWKITKPTGIFYITTQTKVNNIMCPELLLPIPGTLVPFNKNQDTPKI